MNKNTIALFTVYISLLCLVIMSCGKTQVLTDNITNTNSSERVESLMSKMTLKDKVGQMTQFNGFWDVTGPMSAADDNRWKYDLLTAGQVGSMLNVSGAEQVRKMQEVAVNSGLGIPMLFGLDVIHGHKTLTPIPIAESCSWNLELIEKAAANAAKESAARGINWTFAPMVDISRDARWGRVMEGAGEDTYLGSKIGAARVRGFQGKDLADPFTIAATAKHFAGYGFAEAGRDYNTADVGTSTLYNVILPPFKACVDADVKTVMNSFNVLNGIAATGDRFLQRDILKGKWDFDGFVISDWGSANEMIDHGFAENKKHAAILAANAGSDMDMESYAYTRFLEEAVNEGSVDIKYVDDAVRRILTVKEELGLFDDPFKYCDTVREKELVYHPDFAKEALAIAKESIVLLKNENNLLPLSKDQKRIAVIGPLADDKTSPLGSWRIGSDDNTAISVAEGLKAMDINFDHAQGAVLNTNDPNFIFEIKVNETDKSGFDAAVALAKKSEVVVMVLGEHGFQSGEGRSRTKLDLPGVQQELLEAVHAVNPNIVLVVMSGRPLVLSWAEENIPAIVHTWQLGTQCGNAIATTLFGENNPSGKLVMSFPRSLGQVPIYYNQFNTGRPGPLTDVVFWSHYIDEENSPLYPFGYGLSYSQFEYSNLTINDANPKNIAVSTKVCNTSDVAGKEVVQLYIRDHVGSVVRPIKELKGFEKINFDADECKTVTFSLTEKELGFFDNNGNFIIEDGDFDVMVGGSSNAELKSSFKLNQTTTNVED